MRKPANPFILSGYHSPAYFCDRESELAWLLQQLGNERNAVIHSWRRIGKTALLRHFFYHLALKKKAHGIFVDLLGTASLGDANKRIASAIIQRFGEPKKPIGAGLLKLISSIGATVGLDPVSGTPQVTFGLAATQSVPASMEAMGKFISEIKKPVVICLDEFQQITNYPDTNAEAVFRTWVQDFPMLRFIFSGSHRNMMVSMFSEKARPFYRSAEIRQLDPLAPDVYRSFIQSHFKMAGKKVSDTHIDAVFAWTRMQTYYAQLVFNKLFANSGQVTEAMIEDVFSEIIQQEGPAFSNYQMLFTRFQWKLLVAIARAEYVENPLSHIFLSQHFLGAPSSVSAALRMLVKKEFVIYLEGKYTLHDTLLMRWLQRI